MAIEVPMSSYICRWCGGPYSVPTIIANNDGIIKRCALGHSHATNRTPDEQIRDARAERDELRSRLAKRQKYESQLRGQITRLKKRLDAAAKEGR